MNYKKLSSRNIIKDGDEYSEDCGLTWQKSEAAGYSVRASKTGHGVIYRRPVAGKPVQPEGRYWIQEQAPAGNFFDSIGLDPRTTEAEALNRFRSHKAYALKRGGVVRLVVRNDVVISS